MKRIIALIKGQIGKFFVAPYYITLDDGREYTVLLERSIPREKVPQRIREALAEIGVKATPAFAYEKVSWRKVDYEVFCIPTVNKG